MELYETRYIVDILLRGFSKVINADEFHMFKPFKPSSVLLFTVCIKIQNKNWLVIYEKEEVALNRSEAKMKSKFPSFFFKQEGHFPLSIKFPCNITTNSVLVTKFFTFWRWWRHRRNLQLFNNLTTMKLTTEWKVEKF